MKQKTMFLTLAASAMIAASFTSCSRDDNPIGEAIPSPVVDNFDEGSVIQNGTCEGSLVDNFWVNIGQDGAQYAGPATIKKEKRADNHCIEVDVRSEEEARAAGNFGAQTWADPNAYADHDTQFFITFGENQALNNKDQIRITMDIKADVAFTAATGAHAAPGAYLSGFNNINVNFTTEWTSFDTGWITATGNPKVGTYSIAFNLAKGFANKVYFDNIKVEIIRFIPDPEPEKIEGMKVIFWNWGLAKEDQLSVKYFKNYTAPVAEDGAIVVESLEPGKVYTQYYMADNNGNQIDAVLTNDWDTQFLIGLPEPLPKGTKGKLVMKVKADKATKAGTQCHKAIPAPGAIEGKDGYAGTYMHWAFLGDITFTETWETVAVDFTVPDDGDGVQSICLNLEGLREVNKYYFDDIAVYVEKGEEPTWVIDYADPKDAQGNSVTGYPYYRMGAPEGSSYDVENGILVINNTVERANNWDLQPFIIDWLTLKTDANYKVRITMASSVAGKANLSFGTWSNAMNQEFEFAASEDFKQYDIEFKSSTVESTGDVHVLFQCGKFVGTVKIKKVEVFEL